jgi:hypothetical protein
VIETHEHAGDFKEWERDQMAYAALMHKSRFRFTRCPSLGKHRNRRNGLSSNHS